MKKEKLKAALAPLYLELYEEVTPELKGSLLPLLERVARLLEEEASVEMLPVITTQADVEKAVQLCRREDIDCIVTLHLAYSPSLLTAGAFAGVGKPILILDTTIDEGFDAMSVEYLLRNHGIHGVMDFAAVLRTMGSPYIICAGYYTDESFRETLRQKCRMLQAAARFRGQTIAITGNPFPMMGDFSVDFGLLNKKFGHNVLPLPEDEIAAAMKRVPTNLVDEMLASECSRYTFCGDMGALRVNIRQYLAMTALFEKNAVAAYTMNFNHFLKTPVPFYAVNNMMKNGIGYAGEGDVLTASLGVPLNILSEKACFSEFFCPDWKRDLLLLSHMGECDPRFAKRDGRITIEKKAALGKSIPSYYYKFEAQSMEMTFVTWTKNPGGSLQLLAGTMDCLSHRPFDELGAPHFIVRPKTEIAEFLTEYSDNGGGHHLYVAQGDIVYMLAGFAAAIGVDFHHMD